MYGTYLRLNLLVTASNIEVIRATYCKLHPNARRAPEARADRHSIYRQMLDHHAKARKLYDDVQSGDVTPDEDCPSCGEKRDEADSTWQQWQCSCCGSWNDKD